MAAPSTLTTGDSFAVDLADAAATPTLVESLRGEHILEMSGAYAKMALLTGHGEAKRVEPGSTAAEPIGELNGLNGMLAQVAFGHKHMAALTHSGQVYTLGTGDQGQLGHGNTLGCEEPKLVQTLADRAVAQVACGRAFCLALTAEGDVYGWGAADEGQLGIGRTQPSFVPRYLSALQGTPVAMIATGAAHCAALSVYGRVYTWGEALCGQLGLGLPLRSKPAPCEVTALPDCMAVACGDFHTVALSAEGDVYSWGLATRGPPVQRTKTPLPIKLSGLPEPMSAIACGGGSTMLVGAESGEVLCWPGKGSEMRAVPLPPGLKASRVACAGAGATLFVDTSITQIMPSCAPVHGGSLLELHGAGFYESDGIVLRLTHASGQQKLVRGKMSVDGHGALVVTAEAPSFDESGPGEVAVAVSFEEGEGDTFTTSPISIRCYEPPSLVAAMPCCAPAVQPTRVLLKAATAGTLFDAPFAKAFFYDSNGHGAVFASVAATYSPEEDAMVVETPLVEEAQPTAFVRLALDGQSAAPDGKPLYLHAPIEIATLKPRCGPALGGTKLSVTGTSLFSSPHIAARFTVVAPPPPPAPPPAPAPSPAEEPAEGEELAAVADDAPAEGEEAAPAPAPVEPAPVRLEEGTVFEVAGVYEAGADELSFTMPAQAGVAELACELTVDGVHFTPAPHAFTLAAPTALASVTPAVGCLEGGTTLQIRGKGLFASPDLAILFVKGATRKVVPATYDPLLDCATCVAPAWPPAIAVAKSIAGVYAEALAAHAEAEEGTEPPEQPVLDLVDAGDAIVEVSLNGQQWTTDCKHFGFVGEPAVKALDPPSGPLEGGGSVKVNGHYFSDTGHLTARLTKLPDPLEEGDLAVLPTGDDVLVVDVPCTLADEGASCEFVVPAFEGLEEAFDVCVQIANDGQIFSPTLAVYKYEAGAAKGKKK